MKEW